MICLGKNKVLFSSRLSWVILSSLYSQVYCGLMLFIMIPIWEGDFLNFDYSVSVSRREKSRTSTGSCTKSPPLPGVPPQGMADDRCIIIYRFQVRVCEEIFCEAKVRPVRRNQRLLLTLKVKISVQGNFLDDSNECKFLYVPSSSSSEKMPEATTRIAQ